MGKTDERVGELLHMCLYACENVCVCVFVCHIMQRVKEYIMRQQIFRSAICHAGSGASDKAKKGAKSQQAGKKESVSAQEKLLRKQQEHNDAVRKDAADRIQKRLDFIAEQTERLMHFDAKLPDTATSSKGNSKAAAPTSGEASPKKRGRMAEKTEDELLLKQAQVETSGTSSTLCLLAKQPSLLQNGTLRPYQLEGVNWLVHLYENGVSGILAGMFPWSPLKVSLGHICTHTHASMHTHARTHACTHTHTFFLPHSHTH